MTETVTEEVKSVDILAALPTPPHNQNEDIRYCKLNLHFFFCKPQISFSWVTLGYNELCFC